MCLNGVERGKIFGSAKKNGRVQLAKSLTERYVEGECALTDEMQAKAISISRLKPKSGQAGKIFS